MRSRATPRPTEPRLPADTRRSLAQWAADSRCALLVLFGSGAEPRGSGAEPSTADADAPAARESRPRDVDLALWFPELPGPDERLSMIGVLQDLVEPRRADVVFLHTATDPVLRFEVFRSGIPLHEETEGLFVDQTVRALMLYEDALPFRRRLRRTLQAGSRPGPRTGEAAEARE